MESSMSALTYKGSIPDAILESKKHKKLFVVYISGSDSDSAELEKSTWTDPKVAEALSKFCILLHIPDGTPDASNFRAIYPQKSVPCIAAIGYNGFQVWQSEGFVSADVLASSLENAWMSLHIQETTATVLTAALAGKKPETSTSGPSTIDLPAGGGSTSVVDASISSEEYVQSSEIQPEEQSIDEHTVEENNIKLTDASRGVDMSSPKEAMGSPPTPISDPDGSVACCTTSGAEGAGLAQEQTVDSPLEVPSVDSPSATSRQNEELGNDRAENVHDRDADKSDNETRINKSNDVHLNIRLPNGVSLQEKFSVSSTMRMVKDYVDENHAGNIGAYDLAIPYPRKVFGNQDLNKSLAELGLFSRQALIVVPRQKATSYDGGDSSATYQPDTTRIDPSNANNGGYFAFVKRMLSYINPLSYLSGSTSTSSSGQGQSGIWEYSPNPALGSNLARNDRPYSNYSSNQSASADGSNNNKKGKPASSRYGSNIHTLKHDEDDSRFNDKNAFWNGNSTQYGGNNDGR